MKKLRRLVFFSLVFVLAACALAPAGWRATPTAAPTAVPATATTASTATAVPTATQIPTATPLPFSLTAVVWPQDPVVPILLYHQFAADIAKYSTTVKVRFSDFDQELKTLYDSGYSLVSLESWLTGNLTTTVGRRPVIFSMDDLFYNNQIGLDDKGQPLPTTGLGMLWNFYQQHPDFGYHLALFANLGDKLYANPDDPKWQDQLGQAIAWCIDHDALVYNHFYIHIRLDLTQPRDITWQANKNDLYLRDLLKRVHREDLIPRLNNMIALPFDVWPATEMAKTTLMAYQNPEGKPLLGVFEADFIVRPKFLLPPYDPKFDRLHIPRMVATQSAIEYLAKNKDQFPAAQSCTLSPLDRSRLEDAGYLAEQIRLAIQTRGCPAGVYVLPGKLFRAEAAGVKLINP